MEEFRAAEGKRHSPMRSPLGVSLRFFKAQNLNGQRGGQVESSLLSRAGWLFFLGGFCIDHHFKVKVLIKRRVP